MATVNHVRLNNLSAFAANSCYNWFWSLTRSMKKAGWKFKASSNGTTKISNSDPAADNWGSGTTSNAGAAAASIAAPSRGRASVTGLTGIVAADKGRFLLISGAATGANNNQHQIEEVISPTEVKIDARNFAVASDANNGSLIWSIQDPVGDLYSSFSATLESAVVWWCAQGPSVLRIPITSASVGSFIRGENVTQSVTGAEGEFIGYIFSAGAGYLVIAPRVRGTGGGVHGWATANTVTGSSSGATVTQVGTAIDYVYEVVIQKSTPSAILILVGQFDTVADSAEMFSFCATQAGATASVHPGGGGTGNAFGTKAWVLWGSSAAPGSNISVPNPSIFHRGHPICVDAIPEEDYSADGSWSLVYSANTVGVSPSGFRVFGFHRLNDTEDGDLSPYVAVNPGATKTLYGEARTNSGAFLGITDTTWQLNTFSGVGAGAVFFSGWRRRGLSSESFAELELAYLFLPQSNTPALTLNSVDAYRIATGTDPTARVREPIWLISGRIGAKMFKGTFKWIYWFAGDQATDVYGADPAWVQLSGTAQSAVIGPSDGTAWVQNA